MWLDGQRYGYGRKAVGSHAVGSFEHYFKLDCLLNPVGSFTICLVDFLKQQEYISSEIGELGIGAKEVFEACPRFFSDY